MENTVAGKLLIIGGAEEKAGANEILKKAVELSGGAEARIIVITTATSDPAAAGRTYRTAFGSLGVSDIDILDIETRQDANDQSNTKRINEASGIFFTGGDQLRITSIIGGTRLNELLVEAYIKGKTICGTSAGASVMSSTMIVDGPDNEPARKCTLKMAPGLGLLNKVIIDQHFDQRGRFGRLLCGVAENPDTLGIGIDEDTAIIVEPDRNISVVGSNTITIVDGKTIEQSNVSQLKPDELLAISNITVHVLPKGYRYDLNSRKVI